LYPPLPRWAGEGEELLFWKIAIEKRIAGMRKMKEEMIAIGKVNAE
jgi:hypothetical protein